jgi:hypothetical protein
VPEKDKFNVNMQAICDNKLRLTWIGIMWPGCTANYMAWVTSALYSSIERSKHCVYNSVVKVGCCIVGDNAYVRSPYMSLPFKGGVTETQDSYNFYQSQLQITIERSFGVLVHQWAILRGPLMVPISKVGPLVNCLCCLQNYCINCNIAMQDCNENIGSMMQKDACHLQGMVEYVNYTDSNFCGVDVVNELGYINSNCQPINMAGGGEHFVDCPQIRDNEEKQDEE